MTATELIKQVRGLYRSQKSPEYARAQEVVRILERWGYDETSDAFVMALGWGCGLVRGAGLPYVDLRARLARIAGEDGFLLFCAIEAITFNPPPVHPAASADERSVERKRWHDEFLGRIVRLPSDFALVRLAMCVAASAAGDSSDDDVEFCCCENETGVLRKLIERRRR